jgi:hypothetical protein
MKKTLLFIALILTSLGYSQSFDNIPTGTGMYINKLIISPNGADLTNEYIEIRGTANTVVPSDLYLISIEGDGNSSSRGKVSESIQLGDGTRTFGSTGILAITCNYTDTDDSVVTASPYISVISSGATVIEIALEGGDVTSSSSSAVTNITPDIGYDGNFIDATGSYMLVTASSDPKGVRIDGTTDASDADGNINATGDHTSWVLYDSIAYMDDNDEGSEEYGYAQVIFAQNYATNSAVQNTTASALVLDFASSSDINYFLRQGTNSGHTANDWIAAANGGGSVAPNWIFSGTTEKVMPTQFLDYQMPDSIYGDLNPTAASLSVEKLFESKMSLYPNPVVNFLNISTTVTIDNIEVYNVIGRRVLSISSLINNTLDVSTLSKGVYLIKISGENAITSMKFVKE